VLILGSWVVFILLIIYTVLSGLDKEIIKDTDTIRKVWYLFFLFGCLVYMTFNPSSLFVEWKNYLITLIGFVIIDSLLFLNLYFSKFGGHELNSTKKQIDITEMHLDLTKYKIYNMEKVLNLYDYPSYTSNRDEYVQELENFFNEYAKLEQLYVDLLPYNTNAERDFINKEVPRAKVERKLKLRETYYSPNDKYMVVPLWILEEDYVAKVSTLSEDVKVYDIDVNVINMMLMVYILAIEGSIKSNEGGA
jgi:stage II sporulation protein SA